MRIFSRTIAVILLLVAAGAVGGILWLRGSLPVLDGTIAVAGLDAPVDITRDDNGIPHIAAQSVKDAYFGLGFVHAQDRLWQMEMARRAGAGRLAEIFGARALAADRYLRTLGFYRAARASLDHFDDDSRALLDAYSAGVNAAVAANEGPLPPEFVFFGHRPEPWSAPDSIVAVKMMSQQLAGNAHDELLRRKLLDRLPLDQIEALWPPYPGESAPAHAAAADGSPGLIAAGLDVIPRPPPPGVGSNNWVVDGRHTRSGKPLLANDPHLDLTAPSPWYLAHLTAPGFNVAGATLPGIPAIVVGRNERVAWGVTNTGSDVQDLYVERIDPDDPSRYLTPDGARPFTRRDEVLRVKGGAAETITVRETRHGPVISDASPRYAAAVADGEALALAWTALADDDTTLQAGLNLARAASWDDIVEALRGFQAPQQNFVGADIDGTIGYLAPGRVPIRKTGDGWLPAAGWTGEGDWIGFIPFDELPRRRNPDSGRIVTANQKIVADDYPHFITRDWAMPYRARRIEQLLRDPERHSVTGFKAIQTDVVSLMARDFLPLLLKARPPGGGDDIDDRLAAWNGAMYGYLTEPLIFQAWYRALTRRIYGDELGEDFPAAWARRPNFMYRALSGENAWCDDIATARTESCDAEIDAARESAIAWISERYGDDPDRWRWDEAHRALSRHPAFSRVPVLGALFTISLPHDGGPYTVMQANTRIDDALAPFAETHGAALRLIFDLADPDRTQAMINTGQSGNRLSPHYADLAERWASGIYLTLPMSAEAVAASARHHLTLAPAAAR